ncbi:hypothetical protein GW17_00062363, partial [Ensete ventricosum]
KGRRRLLRLGRSVAAVAAKRKAQLAVTWVATVTEATTRWVRLEAAGGDEVAIGDYDAAVAKGRRSVHDLAQRWGSPPLRLKHYGQRHEIATAIRPIPITHPTPPPWAPSDPLLPATSTVGIGPMSVDRAVGSRMLQLSKRYLLFPYARLPFLAPDEYHWLSTPDGRRITEDEMADALVIKTPVSLMLECCLPIDLTEIN